MAFPADEPARRYLLPAGLLLVLVALWVGGSHDADQRDKADRALWERMERERQDQEALQRATEAADAPPTTDPAP